MSDKKYQVFISSTFRDLSAERQAATRIVLDLGHIPAGMELFPAADQEQLSYIKKIIDQCDYYVLIIGGRYGSTDANGVSYTELEYDYAVATKKPVLALIHGNPDQLPRVNTDTDPELERKLSAFRDKVSNGRLVKFWTDATGLQLAIYQALTHAFQNSPAIGWIRADKGSSEDLLQQLNDARIRIDSLSEELSAVQSINAQIPDIATLDDTLPMRFRYRSNFGYEYEEAATNCLLEDLFIAIGPTFFELHPAVFFKDGLNRHLRYNIRPPGEDLAFLMPDVERIAIQFSALGLIESGLSNKGINCYRLTDVGRAQLAIRGATTISRNPAAPEADD